MVSPGGCSENLFRPLRSVDTAPDESPGDELTWPPASSTVQVVRSSPGSPFLERQEPLVRLHA
jgi:hypothetical protein